MSPSPGPLDVLLKPLQFALANLAAVRGLRSNLSAAIARSRGLVDARVTDALSAELELIDAADETARRASISRVLVRFTTLPVFGETRKMSQSSSPS